MLGYATMTRTSNQGYLILIHFTTDLEFWFKCMKLKDSLDLKERMKEGWLSTEKHTAQTDKSFTLKQKMSEQVREFTNIDDENLKLGIKTFLFHLLRWSLSGSIWLIIACYLPEVNFVNLLDCATLLFLSKQYW